MSTELKTGAEVQTTDDSETTLFSHTLDDDTVYAVLAYIVCRESGGGDYAAYLRRALVYRESGGSAQLEGSVQEPWENESDPVGTLDATIDVDSNDVRLRVTGVASTTIDWACNVRLVKVS